MWKKIKKFFKGRDLFSVPFSFRYKNEDSFSTFLGGLFTIIFFIIAILFGINFFIAFCKRKNFSLYFNTINMSSTENITFNDSEQFFAIKFDCDNNPRALDLFKLDVKYYIDKKKKIIQILALLHAKN